MWGMMYICKFASNFFVYVLNCFLQFGISIMHASSLDCQKPSSQPLFALRDVDMHTHLSIPRNKMHQLPPGYRDGARSPLLLQGSVVLGASRLSFPSLPTGDLYIADNGNHVIRKYTAANGMVSTVAGTPTISGWTPDGPATSAVLFSPTGMVMGPGGGSVYWTETGTCIVRKLDLTSAWVSTVAGTPRACVSSSNVTGPALAAQFGWNGPWDLAFLGKDLLITDTSVIRKLDSTTGNISLFAGIPNHPSNLTGTSYITAAFHVLRGIVIAASDTVYVADNVRCHVIHSPIICPHKRNPPPPTFLDACILCPDDRTVTLSILIHS